MLGGDFVNTTLEMQRILVEDILYKEKCIILRHSGEGYFVWEPGMQKQIRDGTIKIGDTLEIEYTPGEFPRVQNIKKIGQQQLNPPSSSQSNKPSMQKIPAVSSSESDRILRSVALKAAAETYSSLSTESAQGIAMEVVLSIAERYLEWLKK